MDNHKVLHRVLAGLVIVVIIMASIFAYEMFQFSISEAKTEARLAAQKEERDRIEKADAARHTETDKKLADLETQKAAPVTTADVIKLFQMMQPKPAPGSTAPAQPLVVPSQDMKTGKPLPDAPDALLFQGEALRDLRNEQLSCRQCTEKRADLQADIKSKDDTIASLKDSLKTSENGRKKTKWQKVWGGAKTTAKIGGAVAIGIAIGKVTSKK